MTSLTFYGGAGEIGGNKILLEDKDAKIYLDFGQSFTFGSDFFYDWLQPRNANGLEVYFEFDMLPRIPKLYGEALLERTGLKYQEPNIDAVLISHNHSDHTGHLPFLDTKIPIYMGHGTHKLLETYQKLYPQFGVLDEGMDIRHFESGKSFRVKHLEITPIHVDHSVPGAYGFIVKTSRGNIVYTGDFRTHGPRADMTEEFIRKARDSKPCALLCEGTRMGHESEHNYTEKEVEGKVSEIISKSKGMVFCYFSMSNVDRFMSVYRAAVRNKRKLVIGTRMAYIIQNMREKIRALPDVLNDRNVLVYFRFAKTCTYCEKDYAVWEREFMKKMVNYKDLQKNQEKYVMHLSFFTLMELVYLQPKGADFIYSSSEHFLEGEENEEERKVWENWMGHFGIAFHKAHCSGHAPKQEIIRAIGEINPEILVPMHTNVPEEFKNYHKNVKIPEKGKRMEI